MSTPEKNLAPSAIQPRIEWDAPNLSRMQCLPSQPIATGQGRAAYRFFHVKEISADEPAAYRLAMTNVLSSLCNTGCATVYLLSGTPDGVSLHIGVSTPGRADITEAGNTLRAAFEGNFLGAKLESLTDDEQGLNQLLENVPRHIGLITGVPTLNDRNENHGSDADFQGVERLVNSLHGETWQLLIVAEPASDAEIRDTLEQVYHLATELSEHIKQSVQQGVNSSRQQSETHGTSSSEAKGSSRSDTEGSNSGKNWGKSESRNTGSSSNKSGSSNNSSSSKNTGHSAGTNESQSTSHSESRTEGTSQTQTAGKSHSTARSETQGDSLSFTRERVDKRAERLQKHLSEDLIERFLHGRSKGMFRTTLYACADDQATFDRLSRGVLSIYQGNRSSVTPLRITPLENIPQPSLKGLLQIPAFGNRTGVPGFSEYSAIAHSVPLLPHGRLAGATWLNTSELALMTGLPSLELPGLTIRKSVDFALNSSTLKSGQPHLKLGHIIQHGRELKNRTVNLPLDELNKHVFITGVTGAGKTTTCMKLLLESGLPFMVIEPAKTEYRALHSQREDADIDYYCLGREDLTPFRLNPFEMLAGQRNLSSHIAVLNATLAAVFPMEASMPYIVEEAIIRAYKNRGWDIHSGENHFAENPWSADSDAWPTFTDMIEQLQVVIQSKGMGKEFEEKYQGSLVSRLSSLTEGTKGRMLNTRHSLDFMQLLDRRVVIELEELKDGQDKALLMGLIIGRMAECMKLRHRERFDFRHLTLVEEAHRLLSRPEPGDSGSQKMGVEMFANLLAEVRKYGEGLIIADQIPNKLVSDVIKNTNTKIVHRLFAADDRNTIGDSMGLSDEQKDFLPLLQPGETIIYCGGWHASVRVQITQDTQTDRAEIDEEQIRQRGRQQLWQQRHTLLPYLARQSAMATPETLADFLREGVLMLDLLLKINHSRRHQGSYSEPIRQRLAASFRQRSQQWQQRLDCAPESLGTLLACLLLDCGARLRISPDTLDDLKQSLSLAIGYLQESLPTFDAEISGSVSGKFVFGSKLSQFDSI